VPPPSVVAHAREFFGTLFVAQGGEGGRFFGGARIQAMDLPSENFDPKEFQKILTLKTQNVFRLKGFNSIVRLASSPRAKTRKKGAPLSKASVVALPRTKDRLLRKR